MKTKKKSYSYLSTNVNRDYHQQQQQKTPRTGPHIPNDKKTFKTSYKFILLQICFL